MGCHGGICRILKTHVLLLVVTFGACGGVLCSFRSWMTAQTGTGRIIVMEFEWEDENRVSSSTSGVLPEYWRGEKREEEDP